MTRTVIQGGQVFDGTGGGPSVADVVIEDGRIVEVGPASTATSVDATGPTVLPGLIDCHVHVMFDGDSIRCRDLMTPFSLQLLRGANAMRAHAGHGDHDRPRRRRGRPRREDARWSAA